MGVGIFAVRLEEQSNISRQTNDVLQPIHAVYGSQATQCKTYVLQAIKEKGY